MSVFLFPRNGLTRARKGPILEELVILKILKKDRLIFKVGMSSLYSLLGSKDGSFITGTKQVLRATTRCNV